MLQKIAIVFSFCFFLVSSAMAAEPSGIDPIQGATQLARPEILRQITSQVEAIQKESPGIEFKLFLIFLNSTFRVMHTEKCFCV